jgi:hypothetical protein
MYLINFFYNEATYYLLKTYYYLKDKRYVIGSNPWKKWKETWKIYDATQNMIKEKKRKTDFLKFLLLSDLEEFQERFFLQK